MARDESRSEQAKTWVTFDEAATAFADVLSYVFPDVDHSDDENRLLLIGVSEVGKLLVVSHAERGDRIRIISAREATRKERNFYDESN